MNSRLPISHRGRSMLCSSTRHAVENGRTFQYLHPHPHPRNLRLHHVGRHLPRRHAQGRESAARHRHLGQQVQRGSPRDRHPPLRKHMRQHRHRHRHRHLVHHQPRTFPHIQLRHASRDMAMVQTRAHRRLRVRRSRRRHLGGWEVPPHHQNIPNLAMTRILVRHPRQLPTRVHLRSAF